MNPIKSERELKTLKKIETIKDAGFNPIGHCIMLSDDTYIFDTSEEAYEAYCYFEEGFRGLTGYWYGSDDFKQASEDYKDQFENAPTVTWFK